MFTKRNATLFVATLLVAGTALAMGPDSDDRGPGMGGPGMHGGQGMGGPGMGMGPDGDGEGMHERMKEELGLSDEQVKKLDALREKNQATMKKARRQMRDLMAKLEDQVDDKAGDAALSATLKELKAAKKEMQALHEKAMDEREAILTPSQQAKGLVKMRAGMGKGMGMGQGKGKGRGKGMGRGEGRGEGPEQDDNEDDKD